MAPNPQCPFCKIVGGEIPSKKVLDTEHNLGILDINPAEKGHVLLLPKDHFMILPQVTPEALHDFAITSKKITDVVFKALKPSGVNLMLANGEAAGQKAPHLMMHIIPRFEGVHMKLPEGQPNSAELEGIYNTLLPLANTAFGSSLQPAGNGQNTPPPAPGGQAPPQAAAPPSFNPAEIMGVEQPQEAPSQTLSEEQLLSMLNDNPKVKELLVHDVAAFKEQLQANAQLATFFAGHDVDQLSVQLGGGPVSQPASSEDIHADVDPTSHAPSKEEVQGATPDAEHVGEKPVENVEQPWMKDVPQDAQQDVGAQQQAQPTNSTSQEVSQTTEQPENTQQQAEGPIQDQPSPQQAPENTSQASEQSNETVQGTQVPSSTQDSQTNTEQGEQQASTQPESTQPATEKLTQEQPAQPSQEHSAQPQEANLNTSRPVGIQTISEEQLIKILNDNPKLKNLLLNEPEQLQHVMDTTPQFEAIFRGHNLVDLKKKLGGAQ